MTQLIYTITFKAHILQATNLYGVLMGTYTSVEKARAQVEIWMEEYEEKLLYYKNPTNGVYIYTTDKGQWIIEPTPFGRLNIVL